MTERRQQPDRRKLLPRPGGSGRRVTDPHPQHGTRARYKHGCRCLPCRAAEATYRAELRKDHAKGKLRLHMLISAAETWRRIRQLKPEFGTYGRIAQRLGSQRPVLELGADQIRVRTMLKVRRLYRQSVLIGVDSDEPEAAR